MHSIYSAIKNRINDLGDDIAQSINRSDWKRVARGISILLLMAVITLATLFLLFIGIWDFLHSFWGKKLLRMIGAVIFFCFLILSYRANRNDNTDKVSCESNNHLEVWAEDVYDYVRDAIFLVLRAVSEHTEIVMPSSPGMVELPNPISIKDGYAVFNFFAKVRNPIDPARIKWDLTRTLNQMIRAHELNGIPCDLVQIGGSYYCPLLILNVLDFGDSINISVVFADEKTIGVARAHKQLNLQRLQGQRTASSDSPYDDQL